MLENGPSATTRRTLIVGASSLLLTGCSLRFQGNSHVPGPTATAPSDISPLQSVRAYLATTMTKCKAEETFAQQASATFTLHQQQLNRIDATLKGLGAPASALPPVQVTPAASSTTAVPTGPASAAKPTAPASTSHASTSKMAHASSSSSSSTPSTPKPTAWTSAEFGWLGMVPTFARISAHSRPLALSLAASSVASTMNTGLTTPWASSATIPADGSQALLSALAPAIAASEWLVAHTTGTARTPLANNVNWLYAARSMASASAAPASSGTPAPNATPAPIWTFSSPADAQTMIRKALGNVLAACVNAAQSAANDHDCLGVLFIWTQATFELSKAGAHITAFPGLTD